MTWNPDAPGEMLDRASRVFWELSGPAAYLNWLQKEVSRTKVHLEYKKAVIFRESTAGGARDPSPVATETAGAAPIAMYITDTLHWYADIANYGDPNAITIDCGERARAALEKYEAANPSQYAEPRVK
jgi:hypothetical protein